MDVRQFHLYIDGRRLPRWFLRNEDTQLGVKTFMHFDGQVERFDTRNDEVAGVYDPQQHAPFAQLDGHALCFRLRPADGGYVSVNLATTLTDDHLSWQVQGEGNEIVDCAQNGWRWRLDSGVTYVIFVDYHGARSQMTLKAVRCRIPLRDRSRELLDHLNRM